MPESTFDELVEAMKAAAGDPPAERDPVRARRRARGLGARRPGIEHDVDFLLKPEDADAALEAFERPAGETERPPEGWLYKAWHENGALVDLIFNPASGPMTLEMIERAPVPR